MLVISSWMLKIHPIHGQIMFTLFIVYPPYDFHNFDEDSVQQRASLRDFWQSLDACFSWLAPSSTRLEKTEVN
jgi:hypothetical protein